MSDADESPLVDIYWYDVAVAKFGVRGILTVAATHYKGGQLRVGIPVRNLAAVLQTVKRLAEPGGDSRYQARSFTDTAFERNRHLEPDTAATLTATLLFLAFTSPAPIDTEAFRRAKGGRYHSLRDHGWRGAIP